MTLSYAEWTCPECKTKNREVAIDGFDPRSNNPKFYMKGALFLLILALVDGGLALYQYINGYYSIKILAIAGASALGSLACFSMFVRITMGFQSKDNGKYMAESKARLANPVYVEKLRRHGYKV